VYTSFVATPSIRSVLLTRPDGRTGNTLIELKSGARSVRALQEGLWNLAKGLAEDPQKDGILFLDRSSISPSRLKSELHHAESIVRSDVWRRIRVLSDPTGDLSAIPPDVDPAVWTALKRLVMSEARVRRGVPDRGHARFAVLHVLLDRWFLRAGPIHTKLLMDRVGCSYPTAAEALRDLGDTLRRHRDRSVELVDFPVHAWSRYVSVADRVRSTQRFADRSGAPRSAASLLERLVLLGREDIAVGGVIGALHHVPSLDVVGSPTLSVTVHSPTDAVPLDFVARLDPALAEARDDKEPAVLIVHRQRLKQFLATPGTDRHLWADPVECLLDLNEAGLPGLAEQYLDAFRIQRGPIP
jgi:hypothetical protein